MRAVNLIIVSVVMVLASVANAHHSHASLNQNDKRTLSGVVTGYIWRSPHVYLQVDVLGENSRIQKYSIELTNPMSMGRAGWDKTTWHVGDKITWYGAHDRDPKRAYTGLTWAEREDGTRLYTNTAQQRHYLEQKGEAIPAYLNDSAVAEPAKAIGEGTWSRIAADGGPFKHIYTPEPIHDWPLTAIARKQVDNFSEKDNPLTKCIINGPPRALLTLPNFLWTRPDANTIVVDRDLWPQKRVIHLDKNSPAGKPSAFGHSVGWFEGDELHVHTDNFVGAPWGLFWGLDSSDQVQLDERYWLSNNGMRLNLEMTITDPVMLTKPVTILHQWKKIADIPIVQAECSLDNANFFLTAGYN